MENGRSQKRRRHTSRKPLTYTGQRCNKNHNKNHEDEEDDSDQQCSHSKSKVDRHSTNLNVNRGELGFLVRQNATVGCKHRQINYDFKLEEKNFHMKKQQPRKALVTAVSRKSIFESKRSSSHQKYHEKQPQIPLKNVIHRKSIVLNRKRRGTLNLH